MRIRALQYASIATALLVTMADAVTAQEAVPQIRVLPHPRLLPSGDR
jgi:hypothetical protein